MSLREDEIAYELAYFGDDVGLERAIVQTLARLPDDVREFALESCRFLSVGRADLGMVLPGRVGASEVVSEPRWLVLLEENVLSEDVHGIVAHEIAHAFLGHDRLSIDTPADCEKQAASRAREWGFDGAGTDEGYVTGAAGSYVEYVERRRLASQEK